jgi:hypothetical protein
MRETTTALSWLGRVRPGPGPRKALAGPSPVRVLAAGPGVEERVVPLAARLGDAVVLAADDVPGAMEAILMRHPAAVVVDAEIGGHELGGFRLAVDCVSLGVPVVVLGTVPASRAKRLGELEVPRVPREAGAQELVIAIERAMRLASPRAPRPGTVTPAEAPASTRASAPEPSAF